MTYFVNQYPELVLPRFLSRQHLNIKKRAYLSKYMVGKHLTQKRSFHLISRQPPGHPIVVIPIGITKKGLPVGIQIHGQKWHDYKVLQMAKEIEKLTNGFKIPDMFES